MMRVVTDCGGSDDGEEYGDCAEVLSPALLPVESYEDSRIFYKPSCSFVRGHFKTSFLTGCKCRQCEEYSSHGELSGYCYLHKRIKDANESCPFNTRKMYKNINMP